MLYEDLLGRKNFNLNPTTDSLLYFERSEIKKRFDKFYTDSLRINSKIEIILYGGHQTGKTHLLSYVKSNVFDKSQKHCIFVDCMFARTPFQFYSQIISRLENCGCLEKFLDFFSSPNGIAELKTLTGGSTVITPAFLRVGRDKNKLRAWLTGELEVVSGNWMPDIRGFENEIDILTNLLRFHYAIFQEKVYPILIVDHCEILFDDLITYVQDDNKIKMAKILSTAMDFSSFFLAIHSEKTDIFLRQLYPKSTRYEKVELHAFTDTDIKQFVTDAKKAFVSTQKPDNLTIALFGENVTSESYPLTIEAESFTTNLFPLEPGKLVMLLQRALDLAVSERQEYCISLKDIQNAAKELFPALLFKCNGCGTRLSKINIESQGANPGLKTSCPLCNTTLNSSVNNIVPNLLKTVVLDTSSLAGRDFSAISAWLPLILNMRVKVIVPTVVASELSAWDKHDEKRQLSRIAGMEYQKLVGLDAAGRIQLVTNAGRNATASEIKEASHFNTIDRIIIETAQVNNAALITRDNNMALNSLGKCPFTILFKV